MMKGMMVFIFLMFKLNWIIYQNMMMLMILIFLNINEFYMKLGFNLKGDNLSMLMYCMFILVMYNIFILDSKKNFWVIYLLIILMMYMMFFSINLFLMVLMYEMILIPMIFIIMNSYQYERYNSLMFMIYYLIFFSLPLIIYIIYNLNNYFLIFCFNKYIYLYLMMIFLVKMSIFMFHIWLPKVHVESSILGSIILSSVLLKMGFYGVLRLINKINMMFNNYIMFGLVSLIYLSIQCYLQNDMKSMIAYSSVIYMNLSVFLLFLFKEDSLMGSLMLMLNHSFSSMGLFFYYDLFYKKLKSRSFILLSGIYNYMKIIMMFFYMVIFLNLSLPLTLGFWGEMLLLKSLINWSINLILYIFLLLVLSLMYNMKMFMIISMNEFFNMYSFNYSNLKILFISLLMLILMLIIFVKFIN